MKRAHALPPLLREIERLRRGRVLPADTKRRAHIASYFSSVIQQIFNQGYNRHIELSPRIRRALITIVTQADAVLRENISIHAAPPLDVIPFSDVPVRYAHSNFGGREQRWGYGFHMRPFTHEGYSVTLALMPPEYTQCYHNHTISEYSLALDGPMVGYYDIFRKRRQLRANRLEMLFFAATAPHTLHNPLPRPARNITFKKATGLRDWRPIYNLNPVRRNIGGRVRGSTIPTDEGHKTVFAVRDSHYRYDVFIHHYRKGQRVQGVRSRDTYYLVVDGDLMVEAGGVKRRARTDDLIVISKRTPFTILASRPSRIYTAVDSGN